MSCVLSILATNSSISPSYSCLLYTSKISYFDYISSLKNPDCNEALKRVCSRIDLDAIHNFLEDVQELLPIQREFYLTMLTERKEKILDYSLELLMEQEQHTSPVLEM